MRGRFRDIAKWHRSAVTAVLVIASLIPLSPSAHAAACAPNATDIQISGVIYRVLSFRTVGTCEWTTPADLNSVDQLVVAGGGAGGSSVGSGSAGGGGGGQVISNNSRAISPATSYSVVVGNGGAPVSSVTAGGTGGSSSFNGQNAAGGGGGSTTNANTSIASPTGGFAGGGGGAQAAYRTDGATGTSGYKGGNGLANNSDANLQSGGGGAGAGGNGVNGSSSSGGNGGVGIASTVATGSNVFYGGGGGGGKRMNTGTSGSGVNGGGDGSISSGTASAGGDNTGGGGGGAAGPDSGTWQGGRGGSGIVVVRYAIASGTPAILGSANVGAALIADTSTMTKSAATSFRYQWQWSATSNGTYADIASATSSTYQINTLYRSRFIRLLVFAQDTYGTSTQSIATSPTLAVGQGTPNLELTLSSAQPTYGTTNNITISTNSLAGRVKLLANKKVIAKCQSIRSSLARSYLAVCSWKPAIHGRVQITATFYPDDSNYNLAIIESNTYWVPKRTNLR